MWYLSDNQKQDVVLHEQVCSWANFRAGVLQVLIPGSFALFIYINDLSKDFSSNSKLIADTWFMTAIPEGQN